MDAVTAQARQVAQQAAAAAEVEMVDLSGPQVALATAVIEQAWGPGQVPHDNHLRALAHAGTTLIAAMRDGQPIGVTIGFLGWSGGLHLHSHMTAVVPGEQTRGVGFALKLAQRAACLTHGVMQMRWTYDPLIARNGYFNLVKLGADVVAFHPDFYGEMDDTVNAGDSSDRFEVLWRLDSERVDAALDGVRPVPREIVQAIDIPRDYDALRRTAPADARKVRLEARAAFERFDPAALLLAWGERGYLLTRAPNPAPPRDLAGDRRG